MIFKYDNLHSGFPNNLYCSSSNVISVYVQQSCPFCGSGNIPGSYANNLVITYLDNFLKIQCTWLINSLISDYTLNGSCLTEAGISSHGSQLVKKIVSKLEIKVLGNFLKRGTSMTRSRWHPSKFSRHTYAWLIKLGNWKFELQYTTPYVRRLPPTDNKLRLLILYLHF